MATGGRLPLDPNHHWVAGGVANDGSGDILPLQIDVSSGGALVDIVAGGGGGGGGNVNLAQVGGGNISIGQSLSAASLPVVLPASQITALTPPAAITNYALETGGNLATLVTNTTALATASAQTTGNTSLSTIATNTTGLATSANLTSGTQQTKITDGTNTAGILKNDGTIATTQNAQIVTGTGTTTGTLTLNSGSPNTVWFDMLNYPGISIEILTNTTPATLTFQTSGDPSQTNVRTMFMYDSQTNNGTGSATTSSINGTFMGQRNGRYFRVASNNGAGTTTLVITFYTNSILPPSYGVVASQTGTWTVQPGNTPNTTAWLMTGGKTNNNAAPGTTNLGVLPAVANATSQSWTEGNEVLLSTDLAGNLRVWNGTNPASTSLNTYSVHITINTTTTPTAATAYISSITISNEVAGTTSSITIQDKQGTPLKLVNGLATTALTTAPTVVNFQTPVKMVSGIDVITSGAVAATLDVWINYYQ